MAIEAKVCKERFSFNDMRKGQLAVLRKLAKGIVVTHKISDGAVGSKLVDIIILSPYGPVKPYVAIKFLNQQKSYLIPFPIIAALMEDQDSITPEDIPKAGHYELKRLNK